MQIGEKCQFDRLFYSERSDFHKFYKIVPSLGEFCRKKIRMTQTLTSKFPTRLDAS